MAIKKELLGDNPCFISVIFLLLSLGSYCYCNNLSLSFLFCFCTNLQFINLVSEKANHLRIVLNTVHELVRL